MQNYIVLAKLTLPLLCLLILSGCAATSGGRITFSAEVSKEFASGKALSDHNYFYYGRGNSPIVILGLQKKFTLVSDNWVPIANPETALASFVARNKNFGKPACSARGATITDNSGQQIGVWYGKWHLTSITFPAPNEVVIFAPRVPTSGACKPSTNNN